MKEEAFEQFTTLLFMRGSNTDFKETYDGFGLRYSKDKETNEYPKTMQQTVDTGNMEQLSRSRLVEVTSISIWE